ncbi:hypothetical protein KKF34_02795 [Myxococcota bacterium]|nr:hypothetical protein [Myxococcota bacterium]MBU1383025.1 hypothetical protein [Myxococcota bacterium]MBU1495790.1 hypothetical protein [Myxococcota bacterium]
MNKKLDDSLRNYSQFLNSSWDIVLLIADSFNCLDKDDILSDWLQSNWELLVESVFRKEMQFGDSYLEI